MRRLGAPRSLYCWQILNRLNKDRYRRRNFQGDIKIAMGELLDTMHNKEESGVRRQLEESTEEGIETNKRKGEMKSRRRNIKK